MLWETATESADTRGEGELQRGYVSLLLDGQQRISSLYGLIRGEAPPFFDGDARAFSELRFHVETEEFQFYGPVKMRNDPLWLDVSTLMGEGTGWALQRLPTPLSQTHINRVTRLYGIRDVEVHSETVTGEDKTLDIVVDLFNRVNTGGTKLSKGDLALAKLCASWPDARDELKARLARWEQAGFSFTLDWLLRNVNAVLKGRAELAALEGVDPATFRHGLVTAERAIDTVLNLVSSRLGLDHDRVFGGVGAVPVMTRFIADRGLRLPDARTADRLLYWYVQSFLWGRYAGSTETVLNVDLQLIDPTLRGPRARSGTHERDPLDALIAETRRHRADLEIAPDDIIGWSRGARFYPLLYMLSRVHGARDLGNGLELRRHLLGKHASLEVHHVFPKATLVEQGYSRPDRNALANFAFLTLDTNRALSDRAPHEYLPECEARHPGVLASQWIPEDPDLWRVENYPEFLASRRELIAAGANRFLQSLLGGRQDGEDVAALDSPPMAVSGVEDDEEREIDMLRAWLVERGLHGGIQDFALLGLDGQSEEAVLDIAWPDGLTHGEDKVALLLNEPASVLEAAGRHGYTFFTSSDDLRGYAARLLDEAA